MFQRFCFLLLAVHGQIEKYTSAQAQAEGGIHDSPGAITGTQMTGTDTSSFLRSLNVYEGIMKIDETIRQRKFSSAQLEHLLRDESKAEPFSFPKLQRFINAAVSYALALSDPNDTFPLNVESEVLHTLDSQRDTARLSTQSKLQAKTGRKSTLGDSKDTKAKTKKPVASGQSRLGIDSSEVAQAWTTNQAVRKDRKTLSFHSNGPSSIADNESFIRPSAKSSFLSLASQNRPRTKSTLSTSKSLKQAPIQKKKFDTES